MTRIEAYRYESEKFCDCVTDELIRSEFTGMCSLDKFPEYIKNMCNSPIDKFNLFLLSNGFMDCFPSVQTTKIDDMWVSYPVMLYQHKLYDIDVFNRYVDTGMKNGYKIKLNTYSPNNKKMQDRYLEAIDGDYGYGIYGVSPDSGMVFKSLDIAKEVIKDLKNNCVIASNFYSIPSIVELHANPFKNRDIMLDAFWKK